MARARNIKPSFFTNDELAEVAPLGRLLFAGMWTIADRDGRLEDRPRRIKAEVLPYDDCDADALLNDLNVRGFILRYEAGGQRYIQILAFKKHQNPHKDEKASSIPAYEKHDASTVQAQCKNGANAEQATTLTGTNRADSLLPITDSLNLIPDPLALIPEKTLVEQKPLDIVSEIFAYWQQVMKSPKSVLDDSRRKIIGKALKLYSPDDLLKAIRGCSKSPHNMGQNDQKTKYNGLGLILRNAEKIDRFIQLDSAQAVAANETLEQRNARIIAEVMRDVRDTDENTIEMEAA